MITVLKVQLPLSKDNSFALAYNYSRSFREFIDIEKNKEIINEIFKGEKLDLIAYCKCEVEGSKIVKVLEQVSDIEFLLED